MLRNGTHNWEGEHNNFVANDFKLIGNAGVGKVLTSDAYGNGTWQTPIGGNGQLPANTYFISESFNNTSSFYSSLEGLLSYLSNNPPTVPITVILYNGIETNAITIDHQMQLFAFGLYTFSSNVTINSHNVSFKGTFTFDGMLKYTVASGGTNEIEAVSIYDLNIESPIATYIINVNNVNTIEIVGTNTVYFNANRNTLCAIGGYNYVVYQCNLNHGIMLNGEDIVTIRDTYIEAIDVGIIVQANNKLKLDNANIKSDNVGLRIDGNSLLVLNNSSIFGANDAIENNLDPLIYLVRGEVLLSSAIQNNVLNLNTSSVDYIVDTGIEYETF